MAIGSANDIMSICPSTVYIAPKVAVSIPFHLYTVRVCGASI